MLLWFKDLMNVTEKLQFIDPMFQHLSSAFIRGDLNAATRGPFIRSLISCPFFWQGVNKCQEVSHHHHNLNCDDGTRE